MIAQRKERVVVTLDGCPVEVVLRWGIQAAAEGGDSADHNARCSAAGNTAEGCVACECVRCGAGVGDVGDVAVDAETRRVYEGRREHVGFFNEAQLAAGVGEDQVVVERVRLGVIAGVVHVGDVGGIFLREDVVEAALIEVFGCHLTQREGVRADVGIRCADRGRNAVELQVIGSVSAYRNGVRKTCGRSGWGTSNLLDRTRCGAGEGAIARVRARRVDHCWGGINLADAFIGEEEECFVFEDGAADGAAELVFAQLGLAGRDGVGGGSDVDDVEVVARVEEVVAEELEDGAVELVGAGAGDGVDDAAGFAAVFGGGVGSDDGEFLDGVDAEVFTGDASGRAVGVVVDGDAVDAVVVLLRTSAGDGQLGAEAAVAAIGADGDSLFGADLADAGGQCCE